MKLGGFELTPLLDGFFRREKDGRKYVEPVTV
jgi:hypothetical protein